MQLVYPENFRLKAPMPTRPFPMDSLHLAGGFFPNPEPSFSSKEGLTSVQADNVRDQGLYSCCWGFP